MLDVLRRALLGDESAWAECVSPLEKHGFRDPDVAVNRLKKIGVFTSVDANLSALIAPSLHKLVRLLSEVGDPDGGLVDVEQYVQRCSDRIELFQFLFDNPRAIDVLVRVFSSSRYLTETVLRHPNSLRKLTQHRQLAELKSLEEFLDAALSSVSAEPDLSHRLDALRRFQRWELLRIGVCDAFGLVDLRAATVQLSLLAQSLIQANLTILQHELMIHGTNLTVLAMGKLGGEELNYSSDIDLIFLTDRDPATATPIAQRLVKALQDTTSEGFLYRVDVRLRPWGRSGELVTTVSSYVEYLKSHAELWEYQALLKARVVAGSPEVARELLRQAYPFVFGSSPSEVRDSIRKAKLKIEADLRRRGREWGEVKLGIGSIRDVEFVVQALQLVHGGSQRHIRTPNTLDAIVRLADTGLLPADEYRRLTDGYVFLRSIEHSLQLMHNRQEHTLPTDEGELTSLARRLDFGTSKQLLDHYEGHRTSIRSIFDKYLSADGVLGESISSLEVDEHLAAGRSGISTEKQLRAGDLDRGKSSDDDSTANSGSPVDTYESVYDEEARKQHALLFQDVTRSHPVRVASVPVERASSGDLTGFALPAHSPHSGEWIVTIIGYDCPGLLSMICGLFVADGFNITSGFVFTERRESGESRERTSRRFFNRFHVCPTSSTLVEQSFSAIGVESGAVSEHGPDLNSIWMRYEAELSELVLLAQRAHVEEAQGRLARRVAESLAEQSDLATRPKPFDVDFDNDAHELATVLHIGGDDTPGFLYELANALTLSGVQIEQVTLRADGGRVRDSLLINDAKSGGKIVSPDRLQELRAAIVLTKHFTHLLPAAPNPHAALLHFRSFLRELFCRPDWASRLSSLERPEVLAALAKLLGVSDFLWEDLLRLQYENLFPVLSDINGLERTVSRNELAETLTRLLSKSQSASEQRRLLNEFKDRELFRIDMRQILGHSGDIEAFGRELTDLAEVVIAEAVRFCRAELVAMHGEPQLLARDDRQTEIASSRPVQSRSVDAARVSQPQDLRQLTTNARGNVGASGGKPLVKQLCPLTVCLLGKGGGRELGFASDIELLFVYGDDGVTSGPEPLPNAEFFARLVSKVSKAIYSRAEGIFHIDLRLRPYGRAGSLAVSIDAFRNYFKPDGPAWPYERQSLVKLRPFVGDPELSDELNRLRTEFVFRGRPVDFGAIRAMREKQLRKISGMDGFHAKLGVGGLVDIEYLVQALQMNRGSTDASLRTTNTREALDALVRSGFLLEENHKRLSDAYSFLRRLIEALRMVRGDSRDLFVPAASTTEFETLARRLGYGQRADRFQADIEFTTGTVTSLMRLHSCDDGGDMANLATSRL